MTGWIDRYLQWTSKHEAPETFHTWTAISILGSAIGRRIHMHRGFGKVFPGQIMVILIGGSARVRKSTCAKLGIRLLKRAGNTSIIIGKTSPEAFIDSLNLGYAANPNGASTIGPRDSEVLVFASELSSFLSRQTYTEALLPILTDLSDAPDEWEFRTRGKGPVSLKNVCIAFLGASTPDWLADAIPPNAFGGGFMSRIIFVYQEDTNRVNALPEEKDFDKGVEISLVEDLIKLGQLRGEMHFTPEGREYFVSWYESYMKTPEAKIDGYYGRRAEHMIRIGMILTLAELGNMLVSKESLVMANNLLSGIEKDMPKVFSHIGATPLGREQERVMGIITSAGGPLSLQSLIRLTWKKLDQTTLLACVATLRQGGLIDESVIDGIPVYTKSRT